ncbi:MAG: aldose epimerase family protein [Solirubrobacteraceae bacterium]
MSLVGQPITSADGSTVATYVPAAGMVCQSLIVEEIEWLDPRSGLDAYATSGSTMGIPLLYPWANRLGGREFEVAGKRVTLPDDPTRIHVDATGTPIHGVTPSLMRWQVDNLSESSIRATLNWDDPALLELFPFRHSVEILARVGRGSLTVTTTVKADASDCVPVSFGFHPYLKLVGAPRGEWTVELPECDQLTLDERMLPTGERKPQPATGSPLARTEFDNAYELKHDRATFAATAGTDRITVEFLDGYRFGQVFSPAGAEFVCFEPMTAPGNGLKSGDRLTVLKPGAEHATMYRITVES